MGTTVANPLANLQHALHEEPERWIPLPPNTLEEAGLPRSLVEELILKNLYFRGEVVGRELSKILGLRFSVIDDTIDLLKRSRLLEAKRSSGFGSVSEVYGLSESGRTRAKEYLENNQFLGPAPVPLGEYKSAVEAQTVKPGWLTKDKLEQAFAGAVITDEMYSKLGPAINSFKSLLIYGQPGNGKTFLAEQLNNVDTEAIFIPQVIQAEGQFVKVFDSLYHEKVGGDGESIFLEDEPKYDQRWVECRRPFITTGGELTMDMLDLMYIDAAKIYDAPYQLKANNGVYLIDDFGRQQITPAELLNRWIYPLDRHRDYLSFRTGTKIEVPFECFLIFSSNLNPSDLGDEAFLRRLEYKMYMKNPTEAEYRKIFGDRCRKSDLDCPADLLDKMIQKNYYSAGRKFRRCHPRDVMGIAMDLISFERLPHQLTPELMDRAFELKFVAQDYSDE